MKKAFIIANILFTSAAVYGVGNDSLSASDSSEYNLNDSNKEPNSDAKGKTVIKSKTSESEMNLDDILQKAKDNHDKFSQLLRACESGDESLVRDLVKNGEDINREDVFGKNPLLVACRRGHENIVKYLVEHGADVNKKYGPGITALREACISGNESLVRYLVERGANVNDRLSLRNAERKNFNHIVRYLIDHGANNEVNARSRTLFNAS